MSNRALTTGYDGDPESLLADLREASYDLADGRPDYIEMRPDYFHYLEAITKKENYISYTNKKYNCIPYYYGVKVILKEDLNKPYRFMRGGEEIE